MRLLSLLVFLLTIPAAVVAETRIRIDTAASRLTVLNGDQAILVIDDIAIGRFGARRGKQMGDGMTPLGSYRVIRIRQSKEFHYFIELDYPSVADAEAGLKRGIITPAQAASIRSAHARGKQPPQDTPLGGHIGLHGVGSGDLAVHEQFNWTKGCVAMTNDQVDRLLPLIRVGTPVVIK